MNTAFDSLTHKMQRAALGKTVDLVLSHAEKDPAKTVGQIVDLSKQFYGDSFSEETYVHAKQTLTDPNSKWSKLINCVLNQLDPNVARTTALNLGYEAFFRGTKTIRENRVKYQCNIPWLILFDPTSACNMHCVGCWAGATFYILAVYFGSVSIRNTRHAVACGLLADLAGVIAAITIAYLFFG